MNKQKLLLSSFIFIFLVSSCNDLPTRLPEFKRAVSVVGILDTSQQPQRIYAHYTAKLDEDPESIQNALVEVSSEAQKLRFTLDADTLYAHYPKPRFYFSDRPETLHVVPEMKYHLRLVTAEGDSVVGETVVPGKFTIITPAASSIKVDKSLLIEWTTSNGAYGYIINLYDPPHEYPPGSGNYVRPSMPASYPTVDTTYSLYRRRHGFKKGNYVIKIMAYDQNFHYHHAEGISSCGLAGGYGMFGSAAIDSVSFWIE